MCSNDFLQQQDHPQMHLASRNIYQDSTANCILLKERYTESMHLKHFGMIFKTFFVSTIIPSKLHIFTFMAHHMVNAINEITGGSCLHGIEVKRLISSSLK